jgi:hypothetical protein
MLNVTSIEKQNMYSSWRDSNRRLLATFQLLRFHVKEIAVICMNRTHGNDSGNSSRLLECERLESVLPYV